MVKDGQVWQWRAVMIQLRLMLCGRVADAVCAGKEAIEMIKASIFCVYHNDRLELIKSVLALR
jgi:hypothetical protein